ncbi:unnamed protein product [Gongylonema pulchrum]|uniref:7TM_GPCR_Srx domain-containing protein n=1 Tax=Gongylonema pulchrum TaxID=637853 RepID=A0A183DKN7_9BILA|nr:unnamed protein product [Gongylonema pulchrum]
MRCRNYITNCTTAFHVLFTAKLCVIVLVKHVKIAIHRHDLGNAEVLLVIVFRDLVLQYAHETWSIVAAVFCNLVIDADKALLILYWKDRKFFAVAKSGKTKNMLEFGISMLGFFFGFDFIPLIRT